MVLSRLKELEGVPYTVGKVWTSSFHPNMNHLKIQPVTPVMIKKKKVVKGQTDWILVFFSQSLCNGLDPTNKPLLNLNKINHGLLLII